MTESNVQDLSRRISLEGLCCPCVRLRAEHCKPNLSCGRPSRKKFIVRCSVQMFEFDHIFDGDMSEFVCAAD